MDDFTTLCLNTEAKIYTFVKMNKLEGKVNLHRILQCIGEYKLMDENQSKTLANIKEEIEIEIDELKPNIERFVNNFVKYVYLTFRISSTFSVYVPISSYGVSNLHSRY